LAKHALVYAMLARVTEESGQLPEGRQSDAYLERLADVLLDRCIWVHDRLAKGDRFGVHLQEETLTEDLLLDIAEMMPNLQVTMYTKPQEAREGADWEWWFQGRKWFGVRVQAKWLQTMSNGRLGYPLDYRVGGRSSGPLQVDVLRDRAREAGIAAAYVLYNGPLDLVRFAWDCRWLDRRPEHFGVSFLPIAVAHALVEDKALEFERVAGASRPWPCLVRCGPGFAPGCGFWPPEPPGSADLDHVVARRFFSAAYDGLRHVNRAGRDLPLDYVNNRVARYRLAEPPEYLRLLAEGNRDISGIVPPGVESISLFALPGGQ
jgi:hypothetical protein